MTILLTGVTGFVGSTVLARLIAQEQYRFVLLVRARSLDHAVERTQRYLQPHFDVDRRADFEKLLRERIIVGDLTAKTPEFANDSRFLQCRRVLHMAANTYFGARYDGGAANIGGARFRHLLRTLVESFRTIRSLFDVMGHRCTIMWYFR